MNDHATMMSGWLRPGETREDEESDEDAVEDTPATGTPQEVIQTAIEESDAQTPYLDSESYDIAGNVIDALTESGYVIVRAEDALTAEDRAAIGELLKWMAVPENRDSIYRMLVAGVRSETEPASVKRTFDFTYLMDGAIAAGGTE